MSLNIHLCFNARHVLYADLNFFGLQVCNGRGRQFQYNVSYTIGAMYFCIMHTRLSTNYGELNNI